MSSDNLALKGTDYISFKEHVPLRLTAAGYDYLEFWSTARGAFTQCGTRNTCATGSYTNANITISPDGSISSISNGSSSGSLTLTGAVIGSGTGAIATSLGLAQTMTGASLAYTWPTGGASQTLIYNYNYLLDNNTLSTSIPIYNFNASITGTSSRGWNVAYSMGNATTANGTYSVQFGHNTYSGTTYSPMVITANGTSFTTTFLGSISTTSTTTVALTVGNILNYGNLYVTNLSAYSAGLINVTNNMTLGSYNLTTTGTITAGALSASSLSLTNLSISGWMFANQIGTYSGSQISFGANNLVTTGSFSCGAFTASSLSFSSLSLSGTLSVNTISPYSGTVINLASVNITSNLSLNNIGGYSATTVNCNSNLVLSSTYSITLAGNITTSGTITAQTGSVTANNFATYNSANMNFNSPISMGANNITTTGRVTSGFYYCTGTVYTNSILPYSVGALSLTTVNITSSLSLDNIGGYSSSILNCNSALNVSGAITVTGLGIPASFTYGYYNASGYNGAFTGTPSFSIKATYGVIATNFYSVSSRKKKRILDSGLPVESKVIDILKNTNFFEYEFKDGLTECGTRYGIIAEELAKTLPFYVDATNVEYVPNIYQMADVTTQNRVEYTLTFENPIEEELESMCLRLIDYNNNNIIVDIVKIINYNVLIVKSNTHIKDKVFAYGTYEKCPAVSSKVSELALVAIKNLINRVEVLENVNK